MTQTFLLQLQVCCFTARVKKIVFVELKPKILKTQLNVNSIEAFAIADVLVQAKRFNKLGTIAQKARVNSKKVGAYLLLLKRHGLAREMHQKWLLTTDGREAFENRLLGVSEVNYE